MSQVDIGEDRWQEIRQLWRDNHWLYVIAGIAVGLLMSALWTLEMRSFIEGLLPEASGILFTIFVIDQLAERRSQKQLYRNLIWQLKNHDNGIATHAAYLLREYNWLTDGSLKGTILYYANLENAWLGEGNFTNCDFSRVNLRGAYLERAVLFGAIGITKEKFSQLSSLQGAVLPDGSKYDGRYNLPSDLRNAKRANLDISDKNAMAQFYGVPLDVYKAGQLTFVQQDRNGETL